MEENLEKIHKHFEEFYTTPGVFYVKMDEFILFCSRFALSLQIIRQKIEG